MASEVPLTLSRLPLFPLQVVLFPGSVLPLRVFEVRYLDMIQRCHKAQAPFGVVRLTRGQEVARAPSISGTTGPDGFDDVGTLARIEHIEAVQAGLLHITCRGLQRFRITGREQLKHGLWVSDVELLAPDKPTVVPDDLADAARSLQNVLEALKAQSAHGQALPIAAPLDWTDAGWVANRWCDLLPVPAELKQRLMSLDNPLVRLELVSDILEKLRLDSER